DQLADARLFHRDSVQAVRHLHRLLVVRHYDELRVAAELPEQEDEAVDVGVVERRVYLVQDAEGTGLDQIDREEERDGGQRLLAPRKQRERLRLLPAR